MHCSDCFPCMSSWHHHHSPMKWSLSSPVYRWRTRGSERLSDTQLESGGTELCSFKVCLMLELGFLTLLLACSPRILLGDQCQLYGPIIYLSYCPCLYFKGRGWGGPFTHLWCVPRAFSEVLTVALHYNPNLLQYLGFVQNRHLNSSENSYMSSFFIMFAIVFPVSIRSYLQKIILFEDSFSLQCLQVLAWAHALSSCLSSWGWILCEYSQVFSLLSLSFPLL